LAPITYCVNDQLYSFAPEDLSQMERDGNAMLKSGIKIPVPLEHARTAKPVTNEELDDMEEEAKRQFALSNTGWIDSFYQKDGKLWSKVRIEDEAVARKLPTTLPFVSPQIRPRFQDYTGKIWNNVITHLALTPQPIWHDQQPFDSGMEALALSHLTSRPA